MAENYNSRWTGEQIDEAVQKARDGSVLTGAQATTLEAGSEATANIENNVLKIGIPRGPTGPAYTLTDTDKNTIAEAVKASLTTEALNITYEDGTTRVLEVYVK